MVLENMERIGYCSQLMIASESRRDWQSAWCSSYSVRNPWGHGEISIGQLSSRGIGWKKYPEGRKKLNPVVNAQEFFKHYNIL
jgi:hypothetical protein